MYDAGHAGELQQLEYTCQKIALSRKQLEQQKQDIDASLTDLATIEQRCRERIRSISTDRGENAA